MSRNSCFKEISVWTVYDLMSCSCNPKRVVDVMFDLHEIGNFAQGVRFRQGSRTGNGIAVCQKTRSH